MRSWPWPVVAVAVLAAGCGDADTDVQSREDQPSSTTAVAGAPSPGGWRELPPAPTTASSSGAPVWTGEELILWSGHYEQGTRGSGAAYRPDDDAWHELPLSSLAPRSGHSSVWTGAEVLYWGGSRASPGPGTAFDDGAAYDPSARRWRPLPPAPIPARSFHQAVWTGDEMIVWGGYGECCPTDSVIHEADAAAYDPAADRWRRLADVPAPWSGDDGPALSFGRPGRMLVWRDGHLGGYDIETDRWAELPQPSVPESQCHVTGGPASVGALTAGNVLVWTGGCEATSGLSYDLSTREWRPLADAPFSYSAEVDTTEDDVYAVSSTSAGVRIVRFSLSDNRWTDLPRPPSAPGGSPAVVWTGDELLVWGGWAQDSSDTSREVRTGVAYRP